MLVGCHHLVSGKEVERRRSGVRGWQESVAGVQIVEGCLAVLGHVGASGCLGRNHIKIVARCHRETRSEQAAYECFIEYFHIFFNLM